MVEFEYCQPSPGVAVTCKLRGYTCDRAGATTVLIDAHTTQHKSFGVSCSSKFPSSDTLRVLVHCLWRWALDLDARGKLCGVPGCDGKWANRHRNRLSQRDGTMVLISFSAPLQDFLAIGFDVCKGSMSTLKWLSIRPRADYLATPTRGKTICLRRNNEKQTNESVSRQKQLTTRCIRVSIGSTLQLTAGPSGLTGGGPR